MLGWVLSDEDRADRLIALSGITPDELRARIGETVVLAEIIDFVLRHEPDLIACAEDLGLPPTALEKAHRALAQTGPEADWGA